MMREQEKKVKLGLDIKHPQRKAFVQPFRTVGRTTDGCPWMDGPAEGGGVIAAVFLSCN